jgi:apolipoprotein N-acyltransferase
MTGISYILNRINLTWLNAPPLIVFGVLIYDLVLFGLYGITVQAVILAALLFYFVVETWPHRWLLDLILVLFTIGIIAQALHYAQPVVRSVAHV